jgi:hypothetical protein
MVCPPNAEAGRFATPTAPRGGVIEHQAVVPVVHLKQSHTREPVAIAVLREPTGCNAQMLVGIGEAYDGLLREEDRLRTGLNAWRTRKCCLQFEHCDPFRVGTHKPLNTHGN